MDKEFTDCPSQPDYVAKGCSGGKCGDREGTTLQVNVPNGYLGAYLTDANPLDLCLPYLNQSTFRFKNRNYINLATKPQRMNMLDSIWVYRAVLDHMFLGNMNNVSLEPVYCNLSA